MEDKTTSVHTQETSEHQSCHTSYREHLARYSGDEFSAAELLYEALSITERPTLLQTFRSCRTNAWFVRHKTTGHVKVASSACHLRWCPFCSNAKRYLITKNVEAFLSKAEKPRFLTLTLKHSQNCLSNQIEDLYKFFRQFRRTKEAKHYLTGGIWFFQVKKGTDGLSWHPHLHILATGLYWPQKSISQLWSKITHGSNIVDIRAVKNPKKAAEYVARYASKPCELSSNTINENLELYISLKSKRLCGTFGIAKAVVLVTKKSEEVRQYVKLATWSEILKNENNNPEYSEILQAYRDKTPILRELNCELLNKSMSEIDNIDPPMKVPIQKSLW